LDELDTYTEGLYDEDLAKRAAAAGMICQLFRNTAHLEVGQYYGVGGWVGGRVCQQLPVLGVAFVAAAAAAAAGMICQLFRNTTHLEGCIMGVRKGGRGWSAAARAWGCFCCKSSSGGSRHDLSAV
jgi:hypothetical protein